MSVGIGTGFVILYLLVGGLILAYYTNGLQDMSHAPTVDYAMRLPKIVFYYFVPPSAADYSVELSPKKGLLGTAFLIANVVIYSLVAFTFLSIFSRFRKAKSQSSTSPPPPPSFDS